MNQYVTGDTIRANREKKNMTQAALAEALGVSDKTISKWETGRGFPDITMLEPLADALGLSVIELLSGEEVTNANRASNMMRSKIYVCPVCGNVVFSVGEAVISCCGITLPALEPEEPEMMGAENEAPQLAHCANLELVEDEYFVTFNHEMTKEHYISFIAGMYTDGFKITKLYPEGNPEARFKRSSLKYIYYYCNKHGLYKQKIVKPARG